MALGTAEPQKWEYKLVEPRMVLSDNQALQALLNEKGNLGWELVAVDADFFYFKRPKK